MFGRGALHGCAPVPLLCHVVHILSATRSGHCGGGPPARSSNDGWHRFIPRVAGSCKVSGRGFDTPRSGNLGRSPKRGGRFSMKRRRPSLVVPTEQRQEQGPSRAIPGGLPWKLGPGDGRLRRAARARQGHRRTRAHRRRRRRRPRRHPRCRSPTPTTMPHWHRFRPVYTSSGAPGYSVSLVSRCVPPAPGITPIPNSRVARAGRRRPAGAGRRSAPTQSTAQGMPIDRAITTLGSRRKQVARRAEGVDAGANLVGTPLDHGLDVGTGSEDSCLPTPRWRRRRRARRLRR